MVKPYNPRFPHSCIVYRMVGESEFADGERMVLYEGRCRKYTTRSSRTSTVTFNSQYTLSIPAIVKARAGDIVEVDDYIGHFVGTVTEVTNNNLGDVYDNVFGGTNIYWNNAKQ